MGLARPEFDLALRKGELREQAFGRILGLGLEEIQVEVKSEVRCHEYGTIFVELFDAGHKSGLNVTTAEYWAIETRPDRWVLITVDDLKELVKRAFKLFGWSYGGDNNEAKGVRVPVSWLP